LIYTLDRCLGAGADQHLHSFLGGKGLGSNKERVCRCWSAQTVADDPFPDVIERARVNRSEEGIEEPSFPGITSRKKGMERNVVKGGAITKMVVKAGRSSESPQPND